MPSICPTVLAELFRGLGALKALQAQAQDSRDAGLALLPSPDPKTEQT
jgi:hypothetical protein